MLRRGAMSSQPEPFHPETIRTHKRRISCDGAGDIPAALGHPRVWLEIDPDQGYADCGYCDRRFILSGGVADHN